MLNKPLIEAHLSRARHSLASVEDPLERKVIFVATARALARLVDSPDELEGLLAPLADDPGLLAKTLKSLKRSNESKAGRRRHKAASDLAALLPIDLERYRAELKKVSRLKDNPALEAAYIDIAVVAHATLASSGLLAHREPHQARLHWANAMAASLALLEVIDRLQTVQWLLAQPPLTPLHSKKLVWVPHEFADLSALALKVRKQRHLEPTRQALALARRRPRYVPST